MAAIVWAIAAIAGGLCSASGCNAPVALEAQDPMPCVGWRDVVDDECLARAWRPAPREGAIGGPRATQPLVVVNGAGRAVVAWAGPADGDPVLAAHEREAEPWAIAPIARSAGTPVEPTLTASAGGDLVVAWKEVIGQEGRIRAYAHTDDTGWRPLRGDEGVVSLGRNAYQPRGATSAGGDLLVWNQGVEHGYSVAIATRSRGGDWVFPRVDDLVAAPVLFSNAPMPALNAAGYAVVAWFQSLGDVLRISMSERESPSDAFRKARESDVLSPPHTLAMHPCPTIHGSGSAAVGWIQETRDHQWVLMLATRTSDGAWRLPEDLSEAMAHNLPATGKPIAIFTPNGALHLIWTEGDDQLRRVWWRRRTPDGRWQDTLPLSPVDGFAIEPSAVAAERGLVTAWRERLNGVFVIRARALDQDGAAWHGAATLSAGLDGEAGPPALAVGGPDSTAVVAWRQGDTRVGAVHSATLERAVGPTLDD